MADLSHDLPASILLLQTKNSRTLFLSTGISHNQTSRLATEICLYVHAHTSKYRKLLKQTDGNGITIINMAAKGFNIVEVLHDGTVLCLLNQFHLS